MLGMLAVLTLTALAGAVPASAATAANAAASPQPTTNSLQAASSSTAGANWAYVDDDLFATNWSNQTQVTAANAASLEVQWVVPFPNEDLTWKQAPGASWTTEPGSSAPPLIVNGIVYVVSDQGTVSAMNAQNGAILWSSSVTLNYTRALTQVPIFETQIANHDEVGCTANIAADRNTTCLFATTSPVMHRHGITDQDGIIWVTGFACELWGFNATTGATSAHITNICVNVPGNPDGAYPATYTSDPPEIYNAPSGPMLFYIMGAYTNSGGRSFAVAYPLNTVLSVCASQGATTCTADNAGDGYNGACAAGTATSTSEYTVGTVEAKCAPLVSGQGPLWQIFFNPPNAQAPGGNDPNWDNELCSIGMVFNYPAWRTNGSLGNTCSSLPASIKLNDWGNPKGDDATVSTSWGQYVLNNKTGIAYIGSGEEDPYPYYNVPVRPGLNLYGSSIIAINMTSGTMLWWYQMAPHDISDWDASWAPVIGQADGQQAVFKSTKMGVLFAFNSLTGKPIWAFENPAVVYGQCVPSGQMPSMTTWANGNPVNGKASMSTSYGKEGDVSCMALGAPTNTNWLEHPYMTWPDVNATVVALPAATGSLESDVTYAVVNGQPMIFGAWMNQPGSIEQMSSKTGSFATIKALNNPINVTLTALYTNKVPVAGAGGNVAGMIAWSHYYGNFLFRGSMAYTEGMIVMPGGDGNVHFDNATNGVEEATLHTGASLFVVNDFGLTSGGQVRMLTIFGGGRWSAAGTLGGGAEVPGGIMAWGLPQQTNPNTQTGLTITSTVSASAKTVTTGGSTVTLSASTVVVGGVTTTVTGSGTTSTVMSTVTSTTGTTGINPTTFYVVAALAVIFVIATGALAVMRRGPAKTT